VSLRAKRSNLVHNKINHFEIAASFTLLAMTARIEFFRKLLDCLFPGAFIPPSMATHTIFLSVLCASLLSIAKGRAQAKNFSRINWGWSGVIPDSGSSAVSAYFPGMRQAGKT
jgi:hypothetical protein